MPGSTTNDTEVMERENRQLAVKCLVRTTCGTGVSAWSRNRQMTPGEVEPGGLPNIFCPVEGRGMNESIPNMPLYPIDASGKQSLVDNRAIICFEDQEMSALLTLTDCFLDRLWPASLIHGQKECLAGAAVRIKRTRGVDAAPRRTVRQGTRAGRYRRERQEGKSIKRGG